MRRVFAIGMATALSAAASPALAAPSSEPETRSCIEMRSIRDSRYSDAGYFVSSGGQWWQNKAGQCPLFSPDRSARIVTTQSRQCRGDRVDVFQNFSGIEFGTCVLTTWERVNEDDVPPANPARKKDGR
ncbi:hypothetical protein GCM10007973_18800 [Polymorphobacter multimanifer]|nr:hypothetical protein GCM10007973_18800 [Polymorphobacter multimanifer]